MKEMKKIVALLLASVMVLSNGATDVLAASDLSSPGISVEYQTEEDTSSEAVVEADEADTYATMSVAEDTMPEEATDETILGDTDATGLYEYSINGYNSDEAYITKYNGSETSVQIPTVLDSYKVTRIYSNAFQGNEYITEVKIPGSVSTIGYSAFKNCTNLSKVSFESTSLSSNLSIDSYAFSGCTALKEISIPQRVTSVATGNFENVEKVTFEEGVIKILSGVCRKNTNLTDVVIPSSATEIDSYAFESCSALTSIDIKNVKIINSYAFRNCSSLSSVNLRSVQTIYSDAFTGCTALEEVTIPASLTNCNSSAFSSVKKATFESGITKVINNVFYGSTLLEKVILPLTVTEIGSNSFYNCKALSEIDLSNVKTVGSSAFYGDAALKSVVFGDDVTINSSAFYNCTELEGLTIGDNAKIKSSAFYGCKKLKNISIGANPEIAANAFDGSNQRGSAGEGSDIYWTFDMGNGTLTLEGTGEMPVYEKETDVPWNGYRAFISRVEIDDNITSISPYAFKNCDKLTYINLHDKLKSIGREAFSGCTSLKYIEIPARVVVIEQKAFNDCDELTSITFKGDAPSIGNEAFPNKVGIKIYYPETGTGYTDRLINKFNEVTFVRWDNTQAPHDVVLCLDVSGSMSGEKIKNLKEATIAFVNGVGGRTTNTRIAVVSFESSAHLISDFTTDIPYLETQINSLNASGGTNYLPPLNKADELLQTSSAAHRTIILFSDGQPSDGANAKTLADTLRTKYNMFTVGFIGTSGQSSYRDLLIEIAGRLDHYFEANDVDALIRAFLNLVDEIKKSDDTTIDIKRHNTRRDGITGTEKFCINSPEEISIIVTPGKKTGNIKKILIRQGGKDVLSNESGVFENITPGTLFDKDLPIYVILFNDKNAIVESHEIGIEMCDSFEVTYILNPETGETYKVEQFINGEDIKKPADPVMAGRVFEGWYKDSACTSLSFFSHQNYENRLDEEGDIILYAKWKKSNSTFDVNEDAWHFINSTSLSFKSKYYEMSAGDFNKLLDACGDNDTVKATIKKQKNKLGGSCFGMSTSAMLIKDQVINITDFDAQVFRTADAKLTDNKKGDSDVGAVESMINYYHLTQLIGGINEKRNKISTTNESANIEKIIKTMEAEKGPVVLGLTFNKPDGSTSGHAVIAFDLKPTDTGYTFSVWDCSQGYTEDKVYTVTVTKSGSTYSKECDDWSAAWHGYGIFLKYAVTSDDIKSVDLLKAPSVIVEGTDGGNFADATNYELITSYKEFTISDGTNSATVNGNTKTGALDIECYGNIAEDDEDAQYLFFLPVLADGRTYTITTQSGAKATYSTSVNYAHSTKGFYTSVDSDKSGTVSIGAAGELSTSYGTQAHQVVVASKANTTTPWYYITFEGDNTGYDVALTDTQTEIKASQPGTIDITVESDINTLSFNGVDVDASGIVITSGSKASECVIKNGSSVVKTSEFGYSVVFDSQLGSSVSPLFNIPYGEAIGEDREPNDPRRPGYIFEGWFKDTECKTPWNFKNDKVYEDTVLYAGWSRDANYFVTVTFNVGGVDKESIYISKGSKIEESRCPAINTTEIPDNKWCVDDEYKKAWDFATDEVDGNMKLYALGDPCTVKFVTNCAERVSDLREYSGRKLIEPVLKEREGYTLTGWYRDDSFESEWKFKKDRLVKSTTLYAKWIENEKDSNQADTRISIDQVSPTAVRFTGAKIIPTVVVRENGVVLHEGTDYKIVVANNTAVCDLATTTLPQSKWPKYTVQGIGIYKSNKPITKYFSIYPARVNSLEVVAPAALEVKKNDAKQLATVALVSKKSGKKMNPKDYTVSYYLESACVNSVEGITTAGEYYIVAEAKKNDDGDYIGSLTGKSAPVRIIATTKDKLINKASIKATKSFSVCTVSGNAAIAKMISEVKMGNVTYSTANASALDKFTKAFEVTAVDEDGNTFSQSKLGEALATRGKKTITISPSKYNPELLAGSKTFTVDVKGIALNKNMFKVTFDRTGKTIKATREYDGTNTRPTVIAPALSPESDYELTYFLGKKQIKASDIVNAGTYTLVFTGINRYQGTVKKNVVIKPINLGTAKKDGRLTLSKSSSSVVYTIDGAKVRVALSYDPDLGGTAYGKESLVEGVDFTVSYTNNRKVSYDSKKRKYSYAYATVKGKGNFTGTVAGNKKDSKNVLTYTVTAKSYNTATDMEFVYTGLKRNSRGQLKGAFVNVYDNGKLVAKRLASASQYTDYVYVSLYGTGNYAGSKYFNVPNNCRDMSKVNVAYKVDEKYFYTGEQIKPEIIVTDKDGYIDLTENYIITYGENTEVGTGKIYVRGDLEKGCAGEKVLTFKILPKWAKWIF